MTLSDFQIISLVAIWLNMTAFYFFSRAKQDTSVIDIGWGTGFVVLSWSVLFSIQEQNFGIWLITILITLWGLRLAFHIAFRKKGTEGEDWRYLKYREQWGKDFWWKSYTNLFMAQGLLMFIISMPIIVMGYNYSDYSFHWLNLVGLLFWLVGYFFEVVSDWQLGNFIKEKKKVTSQKGPKIFKQGLWKYSRHPNYFGEIVQWWSVWLIVLPYEYGLAAIISPVLITFLILRVSGVPILEKEYAKSAEFVAYKKSTNTLIPWFPKK